MGTLSTGTTQPSGIRMKMTFDIETHGSDTIGTDMNRESSTDAEIKANDAPDMRI